MCQLESLARAVSAQAELLSKAWHDNEVHALSTCAQSTTTTPTLDKDGEEARNQLIASLRNMEQLVLGPRDTMQSLYYKVDRCCFFPPSH
jgi:hypothetical protein